MSRLGRIAGFLMIAGGISPHFIKLERDWKQRLFASGFLLGRLQGATPGTSASRQELFQPFWDAYNDIAINYVGELDERLLVEGAIKGVFEALGDPYSAYMTEEEYRNSLSSISREFEGIGAELTTVDGAGARCDTISTTCRLTVTRVLRGSPALAAGLLAGDVVLAVDGTPTLDETIELVVPPDALHLFDPETGEALR